MKKKPLHRQWLDRARSNLERAKLDKLSRHIVYEDMCFDCQQAVEKALKALMVFKNIDFQWTHDISGNLGICMGICTVQDFMTSCDLMPLSRLSGS